MKMESCQRYLSLTHLHSEPRDKPGKRREELGRGALQHFPKAARECPDIPLPALAPRSQTCPHPLWRTWLLGTPRHTVGKFRLVTITNQLQ